MGKWNNLFQLTKSGECKVVSCGNHRQEFNAPNLLCQFGMFAFVGHNFGHVFQLKFCMSENVGHTRQRVEPRDSPLREAQFWQYPQHWRPYHTYKSPGFNNWRPWNTSSRAQFWCFQWYCKWWLFLSRMYPCLILVSIGISTGDPCIWKVFLCMSNRCFPAKIPVWSWF